MKLLDEKILKNNIESTINGDIAACRVGGASVIVKQCGNTVYENTFGYKDHNTCEKLGGDPLFRIASMTKPITAVAILIQCARGIIGLYDPVEKFIPGYGELFTGSLDKNGNIIKENIINNKLRIIHLLTHSGGVGTLEVGDKQYGMMSDEQRKTLSGVAGYFADCVLAFEPYSMQYYSPTVAFDILARIVEITSGLTYEEFLQKELFEPLGMKDTTFTPSKEQWARMIGMHDLSDGKSVTVKMNEGCIFENFAPTYFSGGAGLASTLLDYSAFAEMLLEEGKNILPKELVFAMSSPQLPSGIMPGNQVWGLGVRVITDDSYKYLPKGTFGWSGAYGTHFWVDPVNRITAVYMKNSRFDGGAGANTANKFEIDVFNSLKGESI